MVQFAPFIHILVEIPTSKFSLSLPFSVHVYVCMYVQQVGGKFFGWFAHTHLYPRVLFLSMRIHCV